MSDCFNHALDAYESEMDYWYGDTGGELLSNYGRAPRNSSLNDFNLIRTDVNTEKAILCTYHVNMFYTGYGQINETIDVWVPKIALQYPDSSDTVKYNFGHILNNNIKTALQKLKDILDEKIN